MITTIIFDLSEVYLQGIFGSEKHLQEKVGKTVTFSDIWIPEIELLFQGKITEDTYWQAILNKHKWQTTIGKLKGAARKNFIEIKGTRQIIEQLRKKGFTLGLLSNHAKEWIIFCEKTYKYHDLFKTIVYSYEVSLSKPNKEIFKIMLDRLNVKPEDCLFIDDNKNNIAAAKKLGMKTIKFTSAEDLQRSLHNFNINVSLK